MKKLKVLVLSIFVSSLFILALNGPAVAGNLLGTYCWNVDGDIIELAVTDTGGGYYALNGRYGIVPDPNMSVELLTGTAAVVGTQVIMQLSASATDSSIMSTVACDSTVTLDAVSLSGTSVETCTYTNINTFSRLSEVYNDIYTFTPCP